MSGSTIDVVVAEWIVAPVRDGISLLMMVRLSFVLTILFCPSAIAGNAKPHGLNRWFLFIKLLVNCYSPFPTCKAVANAARKLKGWEQLLDDLIGYAQ